MSKGLTTKLTLTIFLFWQLSACSSLHSPPDQKILFASKPRSIVVIPPLNNSIEIDASYTYLATITRPLAEKGYYVFPAAVIDLFMKENGLPTPAEMNGVELDKIRENIGADAVLYVEIEDWGQKYQVVSSTTVVKARMRLVDARNGDLLWSAQAESKRYSNQDLDLFGAVIDALVEQVRAAYVDNTYEVARTANHFAIFDHHQGLPEGPYRYAPRLDTENDVRTHTE